MDSSYKYGVYYPVMIQIPKYFDARDEMFRNTPPSFYEAGDCDPKSNTGIPDHSKDKYKPLEKDGRPSCFFVRNDVLESVTDTQWEYVKKYGYSPPRVQ
jgi:hypothetical protein